MSWSTAALDDLCEIDVGRTPARKEPQFWGPGEPWLSIADMGQGRTITTTKEQITAAGAARGRQVARGTVLLSFKLSIGKVARAGMPLYTNEAIAALPVKRPDRLDEAYLCRALESLDLAVGSNRAAMGNTLNKSTLKQIQIPLPPLPEQRRIAAILDHADAVRAKRRQVLTHLDGLTQSIFNDMFGDPIANPSAAPVQALREWIDPARPITYGILKPGPDIDGGVPYVRVADMQDRGIRAAGVRRTTTTIANEYRRSTLRPGDLLMSIRGHVGRFAFVPDWLDGANITQDSARLAVADPDAAIYVRAAMESPHVQHWMARRTKGAAVQGINLGDLRELPLPSPPHALLRNFAARIRATEAQRAASLRTLGPVDEIFASLQYRAFRGEL